MAGGKNGKLLDYAWSSLLSAFELAGDGSGRHAYVAWLKAVVLFVVLSPSNHSVRICCLIPFSMIPFLTNGNSVVLRKGGEKRSIKAFGASRQVGGVGVFPDIDFGPCRGDEGPAIGTQIDTGFQSEQIVGSGF